MGGSSHVPTATAQLRSNERVSSSARSSFAALSACSPALRVAATASRAAPDASTASLLAVANRARRSATAS